MLDRLVQPFGLIHDQPHKPRFERSQEAALHNAEILKIYNFDMNKVISSFHPCILALGSEFKPSSDLEELLHHHHFSNNLKEILDHGAKFPLSLISRADRINDLNLLLERGNHKSTTKFKEMMDPLVSEDIAHGFALPLSIATLHKISDASLAPLGCHKQETINEVSDKIPKYHMTHDQSFPGPSGLSVNLRVITEELPQIMYSWVLSCLIHYICSLPLRHPTEKTFICKVDMDAAYC